MSSKKKVSVAMQIRRLQDALQDLTTRFERRGEMLACYGKDVSEARNRIRKLEQRDTGVGCLPPDTLVKGQGIGDMHFSQGPSGWRPVSPPVPKTLDQIQAEAERLGQTIAHFPHPRDLRRIPSKVVKTKYSLDGTTVTERTEVFYGAQ